MTRRPEPQLVEAFQRMWGSFPEPVLLVRADRTVLASNDAASALGPTVGLKCYAACNPGLDRDCPGCRADDALATRAAVVTDGVFLDRPVKAYWVPLAGDDSAFVHFCAGLAVFDVAAGATAGAM